MCGSYERSDIDLNGPVSFTSVVKYSDFLRFCLSPNAAKRSCQACKCRSSLLLPSLSSITPSAYGSVQVYEGLAKWHPLDKKKDCRKRGALANTDGDWELGRWAGRRSTHSISSSGIPRCPRAYHTTSRGTREVVWYDMERIDGAAAGHHVTLVGGSQTKEPSSPQHPV